jgi:hypothetical protein
MRRNVLTYKAPPNNEGYDLICIHPDPKVRARQIRVQVKSRYQTDCDSAFPLKEKSFDAFDYVIVVFLNNGYYFRKKPVRDGLRAPTFYTLPSKFIQEHHQTTTSGWERVVMNRNAKAMAKYKDESGFEIIAKRLRISYPGGGTEH